MTNKKINAYIKKVCNKNKGLEIYFSISKQNQIEMNLSSNFIKDESIIFRKNATFEHIKNSIDYFIKWHNIAIGKDKKGFIFEAQLYEALQRLKYDYVLIGRKIKLAEEWFAEFENYKNSFDFLTSPVDVYRVSNDGLSRIFKIELDLTESDLIKSGFQLHHTATKSGYVSRKLKNGIVETYNGRFGEGFTVSKPNSKSTRYYFISYYVK